MCAPSSSLDKHALALPPSLPSCRPPFSCLTLSSFSLLMSILLPFSSSQSFLHPSPPPLVLPPPQFCFNLLFSFLLCLFYPCHTLPACLISSTTRFSSSVLVIVMPLTPWLSSFCLSSLHFPIIPSSQTLFLHPTYISTYYIVCVIIKYHICQKKSYESNVKWEKEHYNTNNNATLRKEWKKLMYNSKKYTDNHVIRDKKMYKCINTWTLNSHRLKQNPPNIYGNILNVRIGY